ncbi:1-deoxy-D-xylulose 5-phosphate reductoisomerase [bioreactor metagenome]|uniref:1-deoxy-D-xylulose-5-phosphate reductoisomerase n=1 Tax=bioreactor metagenome TaxID=1076179 RepID=A0A644Z129_9ZZZZ
MILTASGGAFRDCDDETLNRATYRVALAHPVWSMGPKVTVDSATLMNKALEILEAGALFRLPAERIGVVIHPQSVVHSMVEMIDGSLLAQLSVPDMRFAIQYALTYPARADGKLPELGWETLRTLEFRPPDRKRFPSLDFAYAALGAGGTMPAVLNAANEIGVERFSRGLIGLPDIWRGIERTMSCHRAAAQESLETVLAADEWARRKTGEILDGLSR